MKTKQILKYIPLLLCLLLFFFFASTTWKAITLLIGVSWYHWHVMGRKTAEDYKSIYHLVQLSIVLTLLLSLPRYGNDEKRRINLIYQNEQGQAVRTPLTHYLFNALFPEEEIMNICINGMRLFPKEAARQTGFIAEEFYRVDDRGQMRLFYKPFKKLNRSGNNVISGTTAQLLNQFHIGPKTRSVYLIRPKHYDPAQKYPVVFYMHGAMGNWKLYQGLLADLENCVILSIGTEDLTGLYNHNDIQALFTQQLPFLESQGIQIDKNQLHLIGLSNGGTAANIAYRDFGHRFQSVTFASTPLKSRTSSNCKALLLGAKFDPSSSTHPQRHREVPNSALYWSDTDGHFLVVTSHREVTDFLNHELEAVPCQ